MDTLNDIVYRLFKLNDAAIQASNDPLTGGIGKGISGSVVDTFDLSDVDLVQYMEKRALGDGMDVGDVFQGARRLRTAGTMYAKTRGLMFDMADEFLAATAAVLAQRESPLDKGYLPLTYSKATNRTDDYPAGLIPLKVLVLPRSRQIVWQRDQAGGSNAKGLAITWQAAFVAKDPVLYSVDPVTVDLSGGSTGPQTWVNRGNYIASLNLLVQVGSVAGSIALAAGGANITITVPASTGNRIIRLKGRDSGGPVLTVEENSSELPRFDWLSLGTQQEYPIIPQGSSTYQVTFTSVTPAAGSRMWFNEAYA